MELFTHRYGHALWEVGGSNPGHGTIAEGVFQTTKYVISAIITISSSMHSLREKVINYLNSDPAEVIHIP